MVSSFSSFLDSEPLGPENTPPRLKSEGEGPAALSGTSKPFPSYLATHRALDAAAWVDSHGSPHIAHDSHARDLQVCLPWPGSADTPNIHRLGAVTHAVSFHTTGSHTHKEAQRSSCKVLSKPAPFCSFHSTSQ